VHDSHKGGTGIGLSITRDLVNVLHGTINVSSEVGKGTVFELSVPVGKEHLASDEYVITDPAVPQKSNHIVNKWKEMESFTNHIHDNSKQSILVIEDNEDLRNFIAENLETDYEVHTAENGKTGMSLGLSHIPDLVVTDIKMDGMDGLTLCSNLKNDERTSHIPVIILTARATQEEKMEGLNTGADDYLVKPFNMPELKVRISNLLTQREKLKDHYSRSLVTTLSTSEMESIDDKFMKKVVTIVNKRMSDFSFDVRSLQEELGMSRMHLFRKLKALTGIPPVTLIRNMRLEKAAKLISCKAGNITEIANSVGISNPSYFSKCFRDYFGVLPKDYTGSGEMNSIKVANGQGKHTSQ
jgi:DNA-binding response OmpR family regulator